MKIILHMSISLNGMIARENLATDFLSAVNWEIFVKLAHQTGAMIWGRRTHEDVRGYGEQYIRELDGIPRLVISRDATFEVEDGWQLASSPQHALMLLAEAGCEQTLLVGGAALNTAFARAGLIDEVVINVESIIVGRGIPLFTPEDFDLPLELLDMQRVHEKIIQLHYRVLKGI